MAYLLGTDPLTVGFDIAQDVFDGDMRHVLLLDGVVEETVEEEEAAKGGGGAEDIGAEDDGGEAGQ